MRIASYAFSEQSPKSSSLGGADLFQEPFIQKCKEVLYHAFCVLGQVFSRRSDEEALKDACDKLKRKARFYMYTRKEDDVSLSEAYFSSLAKKKFICLIKESLVAKFTDQLKSGEITQEQFLQKFSISSVEGKKMPSVREVIAECAEEDLYARISSEEMQQLSQSREDPEWREYHDMMELALRVQVLAFHDSCMRAFIDSFSKEQLSRNGAWKICLGWKASSLHVTDLPGRMAENYEQFSQGLPENFGQRCRVLEEINGHFIDAMKKKMRGWSERIFHNGYDVQRCIETHFRGSLQEWIGTEAVTIGLKYAEGFPSYLEPGIGVLFLQNMVELLTVKDLWSVFKDKVSEKQFFDAYFKWDRASLSHSELRFLLLEEMFLPIAKEVFPDGRMELLRKALEKFPEKIPSREELICAMQTAPS